MFGNAAVHAERADKRGWRLLNRLERLVRRGLEQMDADWELIARRSSGGNGRHGFSRTAPGATAVRDSIAAAACWGAMRRHRDRSVELAAAFDHFRKVSASYWPGLFHSYDHPDLPRTNNDLEHLSGSHRHHERRATGYKTASPSTVLQGSVQMIAATATRLQAVSGRERATGDVEAWRELHRRFHQRRHPRIQRRRFRRDPQAHLLSIEQQLFQQPYRP